MTACGLAVLGVLVLIVYELFPALAFPGTRLGFKFFGGQ